MGPFGFRPTVSFGSILMIDKATAFFAAATRLAYSGPLTVSLSRRQCSSCTSSWARSAATALSTKTASWATTAAFASSASFFASRNKRVACGLSAWFALTTIALRLVVNSSAALHAAAVRAASNCAFPAAFIASAASASRFFKLSIRLVITARFSFASSVRQRARSFSIASAGASANCSKFILPV